MISDEVVLPLASRLYPKWNNGRFRKVIFPPRVQAKDDVNVDCRGLESTFGGPKSSPGPQGKGSIYAPEESGTDGAAFDRRSNCGTDGKVFPDLHSFRNTRNCLSQREGIATGEELGGRMKQVCDRTDYRLKGQDFKYLLFRPENSSRILDFHTLWE